MNVSVLLMLLTFSHVCASVYSQEATFTLKAENVRVDKVIRQIAEQSEFNFVYSSDDIRKLPSVTIDVTEVHVEEILAICLKGSNMKYEIRDKVIIISSKSFSTTKAIYITIMQVAGKVTGAQGEPLPGVNIVEKETSNGTVTDVDGNYKLDVSENATLLLSFIGYKTQEVAVSGRSTIDIIMEENLTSLDEVQIVSTGYQKLPRERATGSFSFIDEEGLEQRITTDLTSRLEGLVPGLTVRQDGKLEIRGQSTLYGETDPLIVVDGFPLEGDISTLNPLDIESITVLKDAAAASIYGAQAANGVIIVTTHQIRKNSGIRVDVSAYRTIDKKADFDDLQFESSKDRVEIETAHMEAQAPYTDIGRLDPSSSNSQVQEAFYRHFFLGNPDFPQDFAYTLAERDAEYERLRNVDGFSQIEEYLMRDAINDQYNLSVRHGGEFNQFYGSVTYNKDETSLIGNSSDRVVANLKNTLQLNDRVSVQLGSNIVYRASERNSPIDLNTFSFRFTKSYDALVDANGNRVQYDQISFLAREEKEAQGYLPYTTNPITVLEENDNTTSSLDTRLSVGIDAEIIDGLVFTTKFQYESNNSKSEEHFKLSNPAWSQIVNDYTLYDEDAGALSYQIPYGGRLQGSKGETSAWIVRNQLAYDKSFQSDKHRMSVIGGMEIKKYSSYGNTYQIFGYDENILTSAPWDLLGFSNWEPRSWSGYITFPYPEQDRATDTQKRDVSYYGNASYIYNGKYILSGSGRLDQANVFGLGPEARNNFLWSVGGSWALSKEGFFNVPWVDKLTLRATYGVNGNRPPAGQTAFLAGNEDFSYYASTLRIIKLTNPANPGLRAEKVKVSNLGLDYFVLGGKISGTIEYYHKNSTELLGPVNVDPTNGWTSRYVNYAEVVNRGLEVNINAEVINTGDFSWRTMLNFSNNTSEVKEIEIIPTSTGSFLSAFPGGLPIKGEPIGRLYAYRWAGLDAAGQPQLIDGEGETIGWQEARSRGYDRGLLEKQGTTNAPYFGGFSNTFKYKGLMLNVLLTYKLGHKMRAPRGEFTSWYYAYFRMAGKHMADRWRKPGDEAFTDVPAISLSDFNDFYMYGYYQNADVNVLSASHIRLTDVNLSYDVSTILKGDFFQNLTVHIQGKNLWLWKANDEDIDPEANYNGSLQFPRSKSLIFGIKANF